jgi:hypothetical protein
MARTRTALTPELTTRIVDFVRVGNYVETAAKAAGIHESTCYSWMRRGEEAAEAENRGDPVAEADMVFADFYRQVSQAEGQAEADAVAAVREADRGWQAHMTYLGAKVRDAVAPAERRAPRQGRGKDRDARGHHRPRRPRPRRSLSDDVGGLR